MRKNPTYMALLGPTRLLISEKSATYTIIWQVRVQTKVRRRFRKILWPSQNIWTLHVSFETFWSQMYFKYLHMIHTYFIKVQKLAYDNAVWVHAYLNTVAVIWSLPKGQTKWMCKYRVSQRLVPTFDFNSWLFWWSYQKSLTLQF